MHWREAAGRLIVPVYPKSRGAANKGEGPEFRPSRKAIPRLRSESRTEPLSQTESLEDLHAYSKSGQTFRHPVATRQ